MAAQSQAWEGSDPTPTGKMEFYATDIAKYMPNDPERPPVPHYIAYGPSYQERLSAPRAQTYPLLLQSNHPRWRHHVQMDDNAWLREIPTCKIRGPDGYLYEPLWIHPTEAAKRNINQGDIVKIYNDRSAILGAAYITERLGPNHVYMDHGSRLDPVAYDQNGGSCWTGVEALISCLQMSPRTIPSSA